MIESLELHQITPAGGNMEAKSYENINANDSKENSQTRSYMWWLRMAMYTVFVLSGQTVATILGRLYYDNGGNSKWMATLTQVIGFPVLIPFMFFLSNTKTQKPVNEIQNENKNDEKTPSFMVLASLYTSLGIFIAADCLLYSIGLLYLPVSTYSLICATQIAFNAFFSYFLNAQKFTPFIINSLILLTISSGLLVFSDDSSSSSNKVSKGKYMIGFICTVGASAGYGLVLSVTQLAFAKILKKQNFRIILELLIYEGVASSGAILVGLFASGEWKTLTKEMNGFELGKWSYIMILAWIPISWQVFSIGTLGLITEFSSLFSNIISTFGLPFVPVLAVFIFHDKMNGLKVISMLLALWGVTSYVYQNYLDDKKAEIVKEHGVSEISIVEKNDI